MDWEKFTKRYQEAMEERKKDPFYRGIIEANNALTAMVPHHSHVVETQQDGPMQHVGMRQEIPSEIIK